MLQFIFRRLLQIVPTLFLASLAIFTLFEVAQGDPAAHILGPESSLEERAAMRHQLGLDRPFAIRYAEWLLNVMRFDFGKSLYTNRIVADELARAFPNTLKLGLAAMAVATVLGFALGILTAIRQNSVLDVLWNAIGSMGLSMPSFWLGILLILLFSVKWKILPPGGIDDIGGQAYFNWRYMLMPVVTIAFGQTIVLSRFMRSTMLDVLSSDYIRTARAKGLRTSRIVLTHALRNALIPVVTIWGLSFAGTLGGAVVTESVFAFPGLGRLMVNSINSRDYPLIMGGLMLVLFMFLLINLFVDLSYAFLDPRIRSERADTL